MAWFVTKWRIVAERTKRENKVKKNGANGEGKFVLPMNASLDNLYVTGCSIFCKPLNFDIKSVINK